MLGSTTVYLDKKNRSIRPLVPTDVEVELCWRYHEIVIRKAGSSEVRVLVDPLRSPNLNTLEGDAR